MTSFTLLLASNIKNERVKQNLSQQELANKSDISLTYLREIEKGRANPSIEVIESVARGLGTSIAEIMKSYQSTQPEA